jgi:hypothetical protein
MNKFRCLLFSGLLAGSTLLAQQTPDVQKYATLITTEDLKANLSILASDALEGRETGKRGQRMAAAFIRAHFEEIGLTGPLDGSYSQSVELYSAKPGDIYLKIGKNLSQYRNYEEIAYYGTFNTEGEVSASVIFAGKGRKEDFDQLDVEGKAVVVQLASDENYRAAFDIAREKKAKIVLFYNPDAEEFKQLMQQFKDYQRSSLSLKKPQTNPNSSGVFFISPAVAAQAFNTTLEKLKEAAEALPEKKALKKIKASTIQYKTGTLITTTKSENVLGYLEGTDKKDELVIITAHYDHIGKLPSGDGDLINNGADDDGSGTVSVLQIAKAFAQAKKDGKGPRRSILFMTVTGEEKGLLGSEYYSEHPVFPLSNTVVDLNIDMVGRRDPQHKDSAPYVYVIGSDKLSTELHELNETANKTYTNLIFDYTYNDQNHPDRLYYRSDHWNFAKKNIPIIFYFDGIHEDYHLPSDEVEKIEFDLLAKRAQLVFYTAWEIANREQRITPDKKEQ